MTIKHAMRATAFGAPVIAILLAARVGAAQEPASSLDGHGVSVELARARAATLRDIRYDLSLDITARDSAVGTVVIRFTRSGNADALVDFRGRRLVAASANGHALRDGLFNGNHLRLPAAFLVDGANEVRATFVSEIAPSGASIIRTHDAVDGSDYLYTLLVPADANQLFPCFDQPDLKARVALTLRAPAAWSVIANGSVERADTADGVVTTRFTRTRPLSTYLIAFAAGPWKAFRGVERGRTINLYVRRSRAAEVDADTLLGQAHRALHWMETYFARPYPFEKFDFLLSPAFPFGGMEHPGLTMYNEDRFIFRERPTLPRRIGRFSTILHETAHQWFGDLVTMRWFDDLWLKEGFATYMGTKALADLEPTADAWKAFYQSNKPAAYGVDQTLGTTPLWQALDNLDQAKSAYGPIVYNKAPGVLKQLNYLVGETAFREGIRRFLAKYAYGNATWQDLLASVSTASATSLDAFGRNFMLRPGMPIVIPTVHTNQGVVTRLTLTQEPAHRSLSGSDAWPMRAELLLAYADQPPVRLDVELQSATTDVVAARGQRAPLFVFPNADDYGYFVSLIDSASVKALEAGAIRAVHDSFLRSMLWGALWDQVRYARLPPARFARLLIRELPAETDEQIIPTLTSRLGRTIRAYAADAEVEAIRSDAERVLWSAVSDTTRSFGVRRGMLDAYISIAATPVARDRLAQLIVADSVIGEPMRDPTRWSIVTRFFVLDDPRGAAMYAAQVARDTTADGRRQAFIAGAGRRSAAVKEQYFTRYFADSTLNEDWATGSLSAFNAIEHAELTVQYLRPALDSLQFIQRNRRIFYLGSWLNAFVDGQRSAQAVAALHEWLAAHPALAVDLRQKILQAADELERAARIRGAIR